MSAEAGAAYMVLSSDEAVSIVSASTPADVAGTVEIHETVAVDPDEHPNPPQREPASDSAGPRHSMAYRK